MLYCCIYIISEATLSLTQMKKTYKDLYRSKGIKISIYHINIYYSQNSEIQKISFREVYNNINSRTSGDSIYVDALAVRMISYLAICYFNHIQNSRSMTKHIYLHAVVTCYIEWLIFHFSPTFY